MIEQYKVEEFLFSHLQKVKRRGQGYIARCIICGDSQKNPNMRRLNIDYYPRYDEWVYKCYNGGCPENSGNIQSLYSFVNGCTWKEANEALSEQEYDGDKIKDRLDGNKKYEDSVDDAGVLDLDINDCISLYDKPTGRIEKNYHNALKKFYVERKIPTRRDVKVAFNGRYKNRFILPVYEKDNLVYFQGRSMFDTMLPKYLNPVVIKENIILNSELFDQDKYIIVCEGLIDAWMVENNQGTTCLGASISDVFLEKIIHLSRKGIIISLDNPLLDKSGFENYNKLLDSRYGKQIKYFFMPEDDCKDLNDLRRKYGNSFDIYDLVVKNSFNYFKTSMKLNTII